MTNIFTASKDTGQQAADSLPRGRAWASKNIEGSNTRGLIDSIATGHNRTQQQIEELDQEFRIDQTYELLAEWETSVGIPDECFGTSETIEGRRSAVIDRLRKQPKVTLADLQEYVDSLFPGMGVTLHVGSEFYAFEYEFEVPFIGGVDTRFVIVASVPLSGDTFEYDFEVPFEGGVDTIQLECLLNKILPANVYLIIELMGA